MLSSRYPSQSPHLLQAFGESDHLKPCEAESLQSGVKLLPGHEMVSGECIFDQIDLHNMVGKHYVKKQARHALYLDRRFFVVSD